MLFVLSSSFNNRVLLWVTLLLMPLIDSVVSAELNENQNKSAPLDEFKNDASDGDDKTMQNNFLRNEEKLSTTQMPFAFIEMATKQPINERVKQQVTTASSDNDYHLMKRAFGTFNEKMDMFMVFHANEMSFLTTKLNTLKDKLNTFETLHHEIDQIASRQNVAEQKLHVIQDAIFGSQSINSKLDRLEVLMQQTHVRIDNLMEKQGKLATSGDETKRKNDIDDQLTNDDEQCEAKIEQLVAFVHSFAELNRLENTDILNRLGNMQSQLIQFFDVKETITKIPFNEKTVNESKENEFSTIESTLQSLNQLNDVQTTIQTNSTHIFIGDSMKMPFNSRNNTKISTSSSPIFRKRKRTINSRNRYKRNHKLNVTQLTSNRFNASSYEEHGHTIHNTNSDDSKIEIDINYNVIKNDKQTSAKYGQPSPYGCHQFFNTNLADEIHHFPNGNGLHSERLCSYDKNGSAWTVIQQRNNMSVSENFNRSWNDYKHGFGNLSGEFWYGNDFIHRLTYDDDMELKIWLEAWDGQHLELIYEIFRVDSEENRYNLFVSGFKGDDENIDALKYHHNQDFSTFDRQNDKSSINDKERCCSCAKSYASGWWFNNCIEANLNGIYQVNPLHNNYVGIIWEKWLGDYSLKATKMMIRPKVQWSNRYDNEDYDDKNSKKPPDDP